VLALLILASVPVNPYPTDYFRSPLGIPLTLAGSFAEMRSNHFHSGLDIKTKGKSGYRVYATAEGWISRIAVSPSGFGNALYVTHPNGYVTVYAHLDRFSETVATYVKSRQYARESFEINLFPSRNQFEVTQGDVIAFSGNSGASSGPHLHFEVRNERSGWPENPQLFGFEIPDTRAPRIVRTKLYAIGDSSRIRVHDIRTGGWRTVSGGESVVLDMKRENGVYRFKRADKVEASGQIGLGIQTHDYHNGSNNRLGTYSINLTANKQLLFSSKMERFSFDQTRYINAHVDYEEYIKNRHWIQRSYVLPGNFLSIYETSQDGLLMVEPGKDYELQYELVDAVNNKTHFDFSISGIDSNYGPVAAVKQEEQDIIRYDRPFEFNSEDFRVAIPSGTLYEDVELDYESSESQSEDTYSSVHRLQTKSTPVHSRFTLAINGSTIPERLRKKALIATVGRNNKLSSLGGSFKNGYIETSVRGFGDFAIAVDSVGPRIRPLNISAGKNLVRQSSIRLQIRDNLSGISSYRGEIDGKWVLFSYDNKYALLKHTFDGSLDRGKHTLVVNVEDQKGNASVYEATFTR